MFVGSVQIISCLDSQSKFQMFALFSTHHVGGAQSSTNMAALYWALQICTKHFDGYLKFADSQYSHLLF